MKHVSSHSRGAHKDRGLLQDSFKWYKFTVVWSKVVSTPVMWNNISQLTLQTDEKFRKAAKWADLLCYSHHFVTECASSITMAQSFRFVWKRILIHGSLRAVSGEINRSFTSVSLWNTEIQSVFAWISIAAANTYILIAQYKQKYGNVGNYQTPQLRMIPHWHSKPTNRWIHILILDQAWERLAVR